MSVQEQIKLLVALQKLDSRIFELRKELENQPVLIRSLDEAFKEKESSLKKKEEELKVLTVKRKEKEGELQAKEEGIKKLKVQLYQIKTNKEYQAMEKEIEGQKADVSVIEEAIITVLDGIEECQKAVAAEKAVIDKERGHLEEEKKAIEAKTKEMQTQLDQVTAERTGLAKNVEKDFLVKYERILHSKNNPAIVKVEGDACGGCNINLPPQVINEIRMSQEIIFCGSCARILYLEDENENKQG
ncbi:MAG: C4-type zinc ribbon domain-containing protein [Candidatus Omnitrophica bacterium]|nr:C4-type zinc ribbon domain-containing protein [Candidatus Omnitrophota bacterium]